MSIPLLDKTEYLVSSTGLESSPDSIILNGTMWTVFSNLGNLGIRQYEGNIYKRIRIGVSYFHLSIALNNDLTVNPNRFWLWEITNNNVLNLVEIEPHDSTAPTIIDVTQIKTNLLRLKAVVSANESVKLFCINKTVPNTLSLSVYRHIKTAISDYNQQLYWNSTRPTGLDVIIADLSPMVFDVTMTDIASPPNVNLDEYILGIPSISTTTQVPFVLSVHLIWSSIIDADTYVLERSTDNFITSLEVYRGSSFNINSVVPVAGTYYYRVKSRIDSVDFESDWSAVTNVIVTQPFLAAPSITTISQITNTLSVHLIYTAILNADMYVVEQSTDNFVTSLEIYRGGLTDITDIVPAGGLTYYYRVKARIDSVGLESNWSSTASLLVVDPIVPTIIAPILLNTTINQFTFNSIRIPSDTISIFNDYINYSSSTTALAISTGIKTLQVSGPFLKFVAGHTITISAAYNNFNNSMTGTITSYNSINQTLTVNVTSISGSGSYYLWYVSINNNSKALLKFDIPLGYAFTSVAITINNNSYFNKTVQIYQCLKSWTENATWIKYDNTNSWSLPGCSNPGAGNDYNSTLLGEITDIAPPNLKSSQPSWSFHLNAAGISIVNQISAGTIANNGFIITATYNALHPIERLAFLSRQTAPLNVSLTCGT
jgi:hypothetical protein